MSEAAPPLFAALRKLQLLEESEHEAFFAAVAEQLSLATPVADLEARFKLAFSEAGSEPAALLLAVRAVLNRVAARPYAEGGRASLAGDLVAAAACACVLRMSAARGSAAVSPAPQIHSAAA